MLWQDGTQLGKAANSLAMRRIHRQGLALGAGGGLNTEPAGP